MADPIGLRPQRQWAGRAHPAAASRCCGSLQTRRRECSTKRWTSSSETTLKPSPLPLSKSLTNSLALRTTRCAGLTLPFLGANRAANSPCCPADERRADNSSALIRTEAQLVYPWFGRIFDGSASQYARAPEARMGRMVRRDCRLRPVRRPGAPGCRPKSGRRARSRSGHSESFPRPALSP